MFRSDDTYLKNETIIGMPDHGNQSANHQSSTLTNETAHDTRVDAVVGQESLAGIPVVPTVLPAATHHQEERGSEKKERSRKKRTKSNDSESDYNTNLSAGIPRAARDGKYSECNE